MAYWIAKPVGDGYAIVDGEQFDVRTNAENYAKRRGWKNAIVVTDAQKAMIERGDDLDAKSKKGKSKATT